MSSNKDLFDIDETQPFSLEEIEKALDAALILDECLDCGATLCEALDAYYGRDVVLKSVCRKCRVQRGCKE